MIVEDKVDIGSIDNKKRKSNLYYGVEDNPPLFLCLAMAIQQALTSFGANVAFSLLTCSAMCIDDGKVISEVLCTVFFVNGICTFIQTTFGIRLPIIQGSSGIFLVPIMSILNLPAFKCSYGNNSWNLNYSDVTNLKNETWKVRMVEIQGAIIGSSFMEILLGATGLIGIFMRFIGPLTISPAIMLVGLSLFQIASNKAATNWPLSILSSLLILFFALYMGRIKIPCCFYSKKSCKIIKLNFFAMFSVIVALLTVWTICLILTVTNAVPADERHWAYHVRTDTKIDVLERASWFRIPYPLQWGIPTFTLASILGMTAAILPSIFSSVGDYNACARIVGVDPPPSHAVNRGIFVEGLCNIVNGIFGSGTGSTSYAENIGAIGITKVASRRVIQLQSFVCILLGTFNKFGALAATIPDPIIGGVYLLMFGMITAVGASNLQLVDLNSSRNISIFGFSIFLGLSLPLWIQSHPGFIRIGNETLEQLVTVLLSTSVFVGATIAIILDNTVRGTPEERGLTKWKKSIFTSLPNISVEVNKTTDIDLESNIRWNMNGLTELGDEEVNDNIGNSESTKGESGVNVKPESDDLGEVYDLPFIMNFIRRHKVFTYVPISPTFRGYLCSRPKS